MEKPFLKGDVGMSGHENKGNKKMPTPRHRLIHNPIPTSSQFNVMMFFSLPNVFTTNIKDVGMGL